MDTRHPKLKGPEWRNELERLKRAAQDDIKNPRAIVISVIVCKNLHQQAQRGPERRPNSAKTDALAPRVAWGRPTAAEISSHEDIDGSKSRTGSTNKIGQYAAGMPRKQFGFQSLPIIHRSEKKWGPKFVRTIPRNIIHDKEALYDNTIQLKQYANALIEENHRLKAKLQQLEEELGRKGKLLNGLMSQMGSLSNMQGLQRMQKEVPIF